MLSSEMCGACLQKEWHFETLAVPFYYNAMARYLLHDLKFYQNLLLLPIFANLMIESLSDYFKAHQPEVIIPVPMHRWRMLGRGFNQAHELAKRLGRAYHINVNPHVVQKIKHTPAQARLDAQARHANLKASFKVEKHQAFKHVVLLDDIFTTGTTVNALALELIKSGIERVDVIALFRAHSLSFF
jgi:ComF family protein